MEEMLSDSALPGITRSENGWLDVVMKYQQNKKECCKHQKVWEENNTLRYTNHHADRKYKDNRRNIIDRSWRRKRVMVEKSSISKNQSQKKAAYGEKETEESLKYESLE